VSHVALDEACFLQALAEYTQKVRHRVRRSGVEKPDHRHRWLLRARRERPRGCGAAQKANELTSPHIRTQAQGPALYRPKRVL
jgi:hypothetical protein